MSDFRVTVTIRNGRLLRAIEAAGYESAAAFARATDIPYQTLANYLSLKRAPIDSRTGEWTHTALTLAVALRAIPEDLFPPQFLTRCLERNSITREASFGELAPALASPDPYKVLQIGEASSQLNNALSLLTPRQADVLRRRNGMAPYDREQTLDEIAAAYGMTKERIRQIEGRAQRLLRHPGTRGGKAAAQAMAAMKEATA